MEAPTYIKSIPILALKDFVMFAGMTVPIKAGREQSINAIRMLMTDEFKVKSEIIAVLKTIGSISEESELSIDNLQHIGTLCRVERIQGDEKSGFQIVLHGIDRVRLIAPHISKSTLFATPEPLPSIVDAEPATLTALLDSIKILAKQILEFFPTGTEKLANILDGLTDLELLINVGTGNLDIPAKDKQEILNNTSLKGRALRLLEIMQSLRDELQVRSDLQEKVTGKIGKSQRDAILREQMRQIQEELKDTTSSTGRSNTDYREKIDSCGMPENVHKVALEELARLEVIGSQSPETHILRNYLDLLIALPWTESPNTEIDLTMARSILDADHYGLDKIKKRIIEHLATMQLTANGDGLILLFIGPPGVGKTSLGQSIARALGRKFARASLGGVRDDAEIRGHRRTYIGAMPGRIIQNIKRAGEMNPVFLLDEIDKLGRGFQGDPASALLEVLDPEQNVAFNDHYLDVPYDLSKVFFIATANSRENIPAPLLDRMETIEIPGYTPNEKLHIARTHLLPKELKRHGLTDSDLALDAQVIMHIITHYTREAGVRDLQRNLASVCRASTEQVIELRKNLNNPVRDKASPIQIPIDRIDEILGGIRFEPELAQISAPPGVATGLAWTPAGGEILFIEAALMPGSGKLILTGQLGDVMKESAQIALSVIRSRLPQLTFAYDFNKTDLHVHVPAGAIPKDGPSAGVAMLVAIASLFAGRAVDTRLAMTGEITLRGAITPVGGIKEKIMAAHRAGIEKLLLPKRNARDLREVPTEIKNALKFEFFEDASDVLRVALGLTFDRLNALGSLLDAGQALRENELNASL
jgi:ATP-dependent Lon protease